MNSWFEKKHDIDLLSDSISWYYRIVEARALVTRFECDLSLIDYVPDGLSDFANALANPIKYQSELEKRSKQLSILTGETEDPNDVIFDSIDFAMLLQNT